MKTPIDHQLAEMLSKEYGRPYTAEEVVELRTRAFARIRERLRSYGMDVPESDEGMFLFMERVAGDDIRAMKTGG